MGFRLYFHPTYRLSLGKFCFRSGMAHPAGVFALSLFSLMPFTGLGLLNMGMANEVNDTTQNMVTDCYRAGV